MISEKKANLKTSFLYSCKSGHTKRETLSVVSVWKLMAIVAANGYRNEAYENFLCHFWRKQVPTYLKRHCIMIPEKNANQKTSFLYSCTSGNTIRETLFVVSVWKLIVIVAEKG